MQTLIDIEEEQLNKLLFYTHTKNGKEAINKIIQHRFSSIPKETSLVDELIAERRYK